MSSEKEYHEYLVLERWENYKEENGSNTGAFVYCLPDYRFERIFKEIGFLTSEKEKEIERLKKENERYKEALEFYADTRKWGVTCSNDLPDFQDADDNEELRDSDNERITKGGKTARQALGKSDER